MKRRLIAICWLAAGVARAETPGADPLSALLAGTRGLTSNEAARRAADSSFEARAKERASDVAEARREGAEAGYWPRLTGTARYTRLSALPPAQLADPRYAFVVSQGPPGAVMPGDPLFAFAFPPFTVPVNQYLAQASLTVPISDYVWRVSQGIAAATHSLRAARIDEQAARLKVAADARIAYYQWIRARGQAVVAEEALEQASGHLREIRQTFSAGVSSKADTLRAESQLKTSELLVTRTGNVAVLAEEQLRVLMHDPGHAPYAIGEDVAAPLPALTGSDDLPGLLDEAFDHRLELRALDETAGSVRELGRVARAGRLPRLDVTGNVVYANPNPRIFPAQQKFDATWDAGVVLSWTPTDLPATRATERERASQEAELGAQRGALLDGLRMEVTQAWQAEREAAVALETTRQGLVAAEEGYRVRRDLFRNGKATLIEVTDAETDLTRARFEIVNAHIDAHIARVRLTHAVGRDAPTR